MLTTDSASLSLASTMQVEPRPTFLNLHTLTNIRSNVGVHQLDTRRFAGIFPFDISEVDSVGCSDATQQECDDNFAYPSRSQFVSKHDNAPTSHAPITSEENIDECPHSEDSCYHAIIHSNDYATEYNLTEMKEPSDQRSTCTITSSVGSQSAMDMMWRPRPKIHMCLTDQMGLMQAKSQAVAMMYDAGLKPTNKILCRRRGCADILHGVEALKYHLHIHNIADTAIKCNEAICSPKTSKRDHARSKSYFGTHKHSMTYFPSRNISVGGLLPSRLSPHEDFPEVQHVPSFTTVAKSLVSDHAPSNSTIAIPLCNNDETFCAASSALSCSRRGSVTAGDPGVAMCLSPPSSPDMHDRLVFTPHAMPHVLNPATDDKNDNCTTTSSENTPKVPVTGSRSSMRALSPTRALSPIRYGIRRVLSIGSTVDTNE